MRQLVGKGERIGYIGLGNMGWPGARHLHEAGARVVVWNRSVEPMQRAEQQGMQRVGSPSELAKEVAGGIICLNLSNTDAVQSVVFGERGLIESLSKDSLVIDFGTTSVPETRRFAEQVAWVDAPVSGGQVGAEAATLSIMAGGSEADFCRALPAVAGWTPQPAIGRPIPIRPGASIRTRRSDAECRAPPRGDSDPPAGCSLSGPRPGHADRESPESAQERS